MVIIIVVIVVILVCIAAGCYYGHFIAGKPKTEDIEVTAVDGNVGGKANIDNEAAGEIDVKVGAEGQFSAVPLDSARTDASLNAKAN